MGKIEFIRQEGAIVRSLPGEDHISGLVMLVQSQGLRSMGGLDSIMGRCMGPFSSEASLRDELAELLSDSTDLYVWPITGLLYQVREAFAQNPALRLYVLLTPSGHNDYVEVKQLQDYAGGRMRQVAVWDTDTIRADMLQNNLIGLQRVGDILAEELHPLQLLYAPGAIENVAALPELRTKGLHRVSVDIGADLSFNASGVADGAPRTMVAMSTVGNLLGAVSLAAVHENIGWVQKFPSGIAQAGFLDGTRLNEVDVAFLEQLDIDGYLFLKEHPGINGTYRNDSHTLELASGDYATIEANRTMDKAERNVRTNLCPHINSPLYVDAESGKLQPHTVAHLEMVAARALEDMQKDGELSGYQVQIDPDQDVLANSTVQVTIKLVGVGVMRTVRVKIGFTTKIG